MVTSGDGTFLISLITLFIAACTLVYNIKKLGDPFVTLNIAAFPYMRGRLPSVDPTKIMLSYRNATTNNMLKDFSIKGTICCKNVKVDISNLLPSHIQLAPAQRPPELKIDLQKILEKDGINLDSLNVNVKVYLSFDCSYKRFSLKKEQHFKYKFDRTLALENQLSVY